MLIILIAIDIPPSTSSLTCDSLAAPDKAVGAYSAPSNDLISQEGAAPFVVEGAVFDVLFYSVSAQFSNRQPFSPARLH
jgi:hypothetical protein